VGFVSAAVKIGHFTDPNARTGCTVILFDRAVPAVADVRGGAPGTRETDLLAPGRLVRKVDALLFTGGSAFGLGAADGVMHFLKEQQRGVPTSAGPVPIVPAAVIFDLSTGEPVAPGPDDAYRACRDAVALAELERGQVGAGAGATTNKLLPGEIQRGGFGVATKSFSLGTVTACVVVNAAGTVFDASSGQAASPHRADPRERLLTEQSTTKLREATTLAALLIDAPVDEATLVRAAVAAHDGMARAIRPCHTLVDGDVVFACALQSGQPDVPAGLSVAVAAELAIEAAILDAVTA
jgi:L-aminopeptidase/D-esterase-like protein